MVSKIEWTDATWNPVRGCTRVSPGCEHCYAEKIAHRFSGPGGAYEGLTEQRGGHLYGARWTGKIRLVPEKLEEPLHWRKPRMVFVNSMSDLFHEGVPDEYIDEVFAVMAATPEHTYQILTKRPERMLKWSRVAMESKPTVRCNEYARFDDGLWCNSETQIQWPLPNVWLGVSVEDQKRVDERIPLLLQTPAAVRFLSVEPLLGPVDLFPWMPLGRGLELDWIIVGGESGPGARPCDVGWVQSIVAQCREARVPCFVKQLGSRPVDASWRSGVYAPEDYRTPRVAGGGTPPNLLLLKDRKGGNPDEWPEDLRVREWPSASGSSQSDIP